MAAWAPSSLSVWSLHVLLVSAWDQSRMRPVSRPKLAGIGSDPVQPGMTDEWFEDGWMAGYLVQFFEGRKI